MNTKGFIMVANIVGLLSKALVAQNVQSKTAVKAVSNNPFANPFVTSSQTSYASYAKNKPVQGGYFAGYHNGQPNIVGRRLFVEA